MITVNEVEELKELELRFVSSGLSQVENARRHILAVKYNNDLVIQARNSQALNESEANHYRQYVR